MPRNELTNLISSRLGNHRRRSDVLQQLSLPGLSIDNVSGTPSVGAGLLGGAGGNVGEQVANLSKQLNDLRTAQQGQVDKIAENTQALLQNTASRANSGGSSTGRTIASAATGLLGGAFGLAPLFKGIFDLFGGSQSPAVQPLVPFNLPPSIQYAGGTSAQGGVVPVDYGQGGQSRPLNSGAQTGSSQAGPTVQINVSAMDSRSFLDHSDDIARAVRQAMLQSSSLNDVIADL